MENEATLEGQNDPQYHEISIWVDKYEDLFSAYDSRDYTDRALSDYFIVEVQKLVRNAPDGNVELKFNVMQDAVNAERESIITKNIHEHFSTTAKEVKADMKRTMNNGLLMTISGFIMIICLISLGQTFAEASLLNGIRVMLEPVGWFLTWTGLDMVFEQSKKEQPTVDFNLRMANAKLTFLAFGIEMPVEEPVAEAEAA